MKALKILEHNVETKLNEWKVLFGNALSSESNLSDLTDKQKARENLGLYEEFMTREIMKKGTEPNTIHHNLIIQDDSARFVKNKQIRFWNEKLNGPISGIGYFSGNSNETFIPITITDPTNEIDKPIIEAEYVTFNVEENTLGTLGDTWIRYVHSNDSSKRGIYVGNTGSFIGRFRWYAFYSTQKPNDPNNDKYV